MHCGAVIHMMEECASLAASKHTKGQEVQAASGYHFNFLELVPRGNNLVNCIVARFCCLLKLFNLSNVVLFFRLCISVVKQRGWVEDFFGSNCQLGVMWGIPCFTKPITYMYKIWYFYL